MSGWRYLVLLGISVTGLRAQLPVHNPDQIEMLNRIINGGVTSDPLHCEVQTQKPFLDFAFRFEAGYVIRCSLAQFNGKSMAVGAYVRIQPEGGRPVFLGEGYRMPEMPVGMRTDYNWRHQHDQAEFSGVFAAGIGQYRVELIVIDDRKRIFRKHWEVRIAPNRNEKKAEISVQPGVAESAALPPWHAERMETRHRGPQVTVLLDAAPIFPNAQKLRAWDRAFLMSSLASLLHGTGASKVRLVVFNLEQQRELYRAESFGREQFPKLADALRQLELGSVSYKTLQASYGWADMLRGMVSQEAREEPNPDAVVFLGPNIRNVARIPKELVTCESLNAKLYYLEFFPIPGSEFPDTIHQLISSCHGSVYKMHSPADLADAISKLQARVSMPVPNQAAQP